MPLAGATPGRTLARPGPARRCAPLPMRGARSELASRRAREIEKIPARRGHDSPSRIEIVGHAAMSLRDRSALRCVQGAESARLRGDAQVLGPVVERAMHTLEALTHELVHAAEADLRELQSCLRERGDSRAEGLHALRRPLSTALRELEHLFGVRAGPVLHEPGGRRGDLAGKVHGRAERPVMMRCIIM